MSAAGPEQAAPSPSTGTPGEALPKQRWVRFEECSNFRDLGGYPAGEGRQTKWGLVFRSGLLHRFTEADLLAFGELGIKAVFDLRSTGERQQGPSPVASVHLPLAEEMATYELMGIFTVSGRREAEEAVVGLYLSNLHRRASVLGDLFTRLCEPTNLPALFHCTAGKDRTGLAAALLLSALGTDRDTVIADYALSGDVPTPDADAFRPALLSAGVPADAIDVFFGAHPDLMARALAELDEQYGGPLQYLLGPAGLKPATLDALRELLTEPAGMSQAAG
ncbi:MAG TPA: tyrosine-protein phosphatase [Acidimicrobiales bacterium]|nr:tyrosine-protein phosphatase [Acidimicrobiales bacterium]